jgi:hypothetical protein
MAYYDFECPQGHITELKMNMSEYKQMIQNTNGLEVINCPTCGSIKPEADAVRIYNRPGGMQMNYQGGQRH